MRPLVLIPARMRSTRLPGKPLADIAGEPMIVHVMRRALEADLGPVVVAADSETIAAAVRAAGGTAVVTAGDHASGSDRINEALGRLDPDRGYDTVVNVQGDLPTLAPRSVRAALAPLEHPGTDVGTIAAVIRDAADRSSPNVVKVVGSPLGEGRLRALYFTRATAPWGEGPLYHHIGLYTYRRAALERFVALPPSALEQRERLEQLRLLEAGMRVDVEIVEDEPLGVDTPADLARARTILAGRLTGAGSPAGA